ncbi:PepSY-associated TM helix domain-containing protein [Kordiimonas aquimaris]|uniref:PepSY-associated TM helix domain-containing protein n=1 Tax=Kordiimonas aquimaris TaxID=707591 RepID=UPI0021D00084|nr:PepSY-associated TM helix domain-containing protein [Kordiimonas aquimaris]
MKAQVLFRKIHHWGSIAVALPLVLMIGAGLFLMLKKEINWIQPETQRGSIVGVPSLSVQELFTIAKSVEVAELSSWEELERVDFKPGKGVVKFVGANDWEVQVDTHSGEILQVSYRRSDFIESLHDGSFFGDGVKLYLFLPAGIVLFVLWLTGLYLFFLPHIKKGQKNRAKKAQKIGSVERNTQPAE